MAAAASSRRRTTRSRSKSQSPIPTLPEEDELKDDGDDKVATNEGKKGEKKKSGLKIKTTGEVGFK